MKGKSHVRTFLLLFVFALSSGLPVLAQENVLHAVFKGCSYCECGSSSPMDVSAPVGRMTVTIHIKNYSYGNTAGIPGWVQFRESSNDGTWGSWICCPTWFSRERVKEIRTTRTPDPMKEGDEITIESEYQVSEPVTFQVMILSESSHDGSGACHQKSSEHWVTISNGKSSQPKGPGYELFFDGKKVGAEPGWTMQQSVENLEGNKKNHPDKKVEGYFNGRLIPNPGTGYELFFDGKKVGAEPDWTMQQAVENLEGNKKNHPDKKVEGYFNGRLIPNPGTGYELFFDGKKVGAEPDWTMQQAVENLEGNKKNHPDKKVEGYFNGKLIP